MLKCPSCGRVGDDIGACGSFITCPKLAGAVEVAPTDVLLKCDECQVMRVMAAGRIMHGRALVADHVCKRDQETCKAYPVVVATAQEATKTTSTAAKPAPKAINKTQ
jgi:hypothetical protein